MKLARNLFLALTLLVLLYGGVYWVFLRERVRTTIFWTDPFDGAQEKSWHRLFAPALEVDLRLTFDRPRRKYLRGHWTNPETGDFVTIAGDGTFAFQIGKTRASVQATLDRSFGGYLAEFQEGGLVRVFTFYWDDPTVSGKPRDIAFAHAWTLGVTQSVTQWESEDYKTTLTRAPAP